ncbi:G protein-activated inward rectifier potassium channel 3-like isoform X1 [Anguilla rostrata]|uniref:G protein-activated inward rectifier potassium channel 3-like isoform X1 n=2 Tax=Anguilla rostrata TaxID=7938 RepID=UPI0030CDCB58
MQARSPVEDPPAMMSTEVHSRAALQEARSRRQQLRRNSVPPVRTLRAKHLLAYLPGPAQHSPHPYMEKAESKVVTKSPPCLWGAPAAHENGSSRETSPPQPRPPTPQQQEELCEVSAGACPGKSRRYRKRLSSRWRLSGAPRGECGPGGKAPSIFSFSRPLGAHRGRPRGQRYVEALVGSGSRHLGPEGEQRQRYVTKDGKCRVNLGAIDGRARFLSDVFTTLVDLRCRWFLLVFTVCYVATWVAFAQIYFLDAWLRGDLAHAGDPAWAPCYQNVDGFLSALLLSVESQMTIGYGHRMVTAGCAEGAALLMAQSIVGSVIDVLMMGCMFVKISRPQKRAQTLVFSRRCVVSQRDGRLCLMFRVGDLRESHMVDAKIRARLVRSRLTEEGEFVPLEQSEINLGFDTGADRLFLVEPQTITHVIDRASPFWETSAETLKRDRLEVIVILEGIVEASGMTCQARTSYTENEILWGHRFESCMTKEKGAFQVDYSTFDKTFPVKTWSHSAKEMQERGRSERSDLSSYWNTVSDAHPSETSEQLWTEERAGASADIHSRDSKACDVYARV